MQQTANILRRCGALMLLVLLVGAAQASAQNSSDTDQPDYSELGRARRARAHDREQARAQRQQSDCDILRAARTIHISPNRHISADYLEYKLDKLPEFAQWRLSIVKDRERADLVIEIHQTALNYIFSIIEPASSIVVAKGKVVAINGRMAAEDISHQIVKRMRAVRALP
ncbi:MAG: hypothetical protein ACR2G4_14630 [Pyrinomonadaceae bacterium]